MSDHHPHTPEPSEHADSWHHHARAEGLPQHEHGSRANPAAVGITLLAIIFCFLGFFFIVWGYFNSYSTRHKAEMTESVTSTLRGEYLTLRSGSQTMLTQPAGWVDREAGTVRLPTDRAASLVIEDYARSGSRSAADAPADGTEDPGA